MSTEIVKVQIALAGTLVAPGRGLVYAQGRDRMAEQSLPDAVRAALGGEANKKGYFEARWTDAGKWEIGKRVPDEDW